MRVAPDPVPVLEELARTAGELAVLIKHFPDPGSAPSSAVVKQLWEFRYPRNQDALTQAFKDLSGRHVDVVPVMG